MLITLDYLGQHENTDVFTLAEVLDRMLDEVPEYKIFANWYDKGKNAGTGNAHGIIW